MSSVTPRTGEKLILQEDCSEDRLRNGILTLTNQRIIFEKTSGKLATLSKKLEGVALDVPLQSIKSIKKEGFIVTKVVISVDDSIFKFSVFNSNKWAQEIKRQINSNLSRGNNPSN